MTIRYSLLALALLASTSAAYAKAVPQTLTDPLTDAPLANTPYFMASTGEKLSGLMYTDAAGKTRPSAQKPLILVQAEGNGKQLFIANLHDTLPATSTAKSTPYLIFNPVNNQALCGNSNSAGFSHAYFMDDAQLWYDNSVAFERQPAQNCASARGNASQLLGNDSAQFMSGYDASTQSFVLTDEHKKQFLYAHIDKIIKDKSVDLNASPVKSVMKQAVKTALNDNNDGRLNSMGYSLGFERQEYKKGLALLDDSLRIKPDDCYATNSKGYLLMRTGDLKQSREYFEASDKACLEAAKANPDEDYAYPLAVNYAHLAENYGLSGDNNQANSYFNHALRIGSAKARDEITEVATHLQEKQILSKANLELFISYIRWIEQPAAPKAAITKKK